MHMARAQLAKLYKQLLTECGKFSDYNFRDHAIRRVTHHYEKYLEESDESKLKEILPQVEGEFEVIQRQVAVGQLYAAEKHILDKVNS